MKTPAALLCALACWSGLAGAAEAKQKQLKWVGAMCEYSARFDPAKVPEAALRDTAYLLYQSQLESFVGNGIVERPDQIAKLDAAKIESECSARRDKLVNLQLLSFEGFLPRLEAYRQSLIDQHDDACQFTLIQLRGYSDPSALRAYKRAPVCEKYIDAMEDEKKIEPAWRAFVEELCKDNASVEDCRQRELDKANRPDAKIWMRLTMIDFAWGNCANNHTLRNTTDNEATLARLTTPFSKIYRVKQQCEEP